MSHSRKRPAAAAAAAGALVANPRSQGVFSPTAAATGGAAPVSTGPTRGAETNHVRRFFPKRPSRFQHVVNSCDVRKTILLVATLLLASCNSQNPGAITTANAAPSRHYDDAQLVRGQALFRDNCAECHGAGAQGAFNWRQPGPDGKYLAPPLNGSGHTWHHPKAALKRTIRHGTTAIGGSMPPWRDRLSEQDIEDLVTWFQSLWSDEVYQAWWEIDQRAQQVRR